MAKVSIFLICCIAFLASVVPSMAQTGNKRLILKDGSYQIVREYKVVGDRVRYFSAERQEWEELPASMVDWAATAAWAKDHAPGAKTAEPVEPAGPNSEASEIDKEEQQERAAQNARTPDVLPGLRLPDQDGVWVLDTFQGRPELVQLEQNTGNVNKQTGHNILRGALNPMGGIKQNIEISGAMSHVQLHVGSPALYVSLTTDDLEPGDAGVLTVNTHGASSAEQKDSDSSPSSQYVIVRVYPNYRRNYRVVGRVKIGLSGNASQTEDIIPTTKQILPGKQWMKLTPQSPLTFGEYALMEILGQGEVNLSVWDFRIDPQGPENKNAIMQLGQTRP